LPVAYWPALMRSASSVLPAAAIAVARIASPTFRSASVTLPLASRSGARSFVAELTVIVFVTPALSVIVSDELPTAVTTPRVLAPR